MSFNRVFTGTKFGGNSVETYKATLKAEAEERLRAFPWLFDVNPANIATLFSDTSKTTTPVDGGYVLRVNNNVPYDVLGHFQTVDNSTAPLYRKNGFNNLPSLEFASGDWLANPKLGTALTINAYVLLIALTQDLPAASSANTVFYSDGGADGYGGTDEILAVWSGDGSHVPYSNCGYSAYDWSYNQYFDPGGASGITAKLDHPMLMAIRLSATGANSKNITNNVATTDTANTLAAKSLKQFGFGQRFLQAGWKNAGMQLGRAMMLNAEVSDSEWLQLLADFKTVCGLGF